MRGARASLRVECAGLPRLPMRARGGFARAFRRCCSTPLTIFVSAFLLFLVQPIVAKQILPWFGGSAAVWTTCLVFFQTALLAGYAYSDWIVRRLAPRARSASCTSRCCSSASSLLPIIPGAHWKPAGTESPSWLILGLLAATIGLPYFLLSTTSPLVQAWFARRCPGAQPVSAVRAVESRVDAGARRLSVPARAVGRRRACRRWGWSVGYALFVGSVRAAACVEPAARAHAVASARTRSAGAGRASTSAPPTARAAGALVRARRHRLAAAARGVQPHHAEHRRRAAPVDRAARRSIC